MFFAMFSTQAQTFIPGSMLEYKNPFSATPYATFLVSEVSNYHFEKVDFHLGDIEDEEINNDLYVWSWTSMNVPSNTPACGIGWKRTQAGHPDSVIDDGCIFLNKYISSPEIAFIKVEGEIWVFLAYYQSNLYQFGGTSGHKYDIYRWDSDTLSIIDTGIVLSNSQIHTRISIDAHRLYAIGMTWEYMENIYVKTFDSRADTLSVGASQLVRNAATGLSPDIAFSHPLGNLLVRILYGQESAIISGDYDYYVSHYNFDSLMLPPSFPIHFIRDDSFHATTFYPAANGLDIMGHQLDCSDHASDDTWAYSYYDGDENKIKVRLYNGAIPDTVDIDVSAPYFLTLDDWIFGSHSLAYDKDYRKVHVGFHATKYPSTGSPSTYINYYAATYRNDGTKIGTLPTEFKEIANTPYRPFTIPALTFSKQNDAGSQIFTSYNGFKPGIAIDSAGIIHKHALIPTVDSHFKNWIPLSKSEQLLVYPNPVQLGISKISLPISWYNYTQLNIRILSTSGIVILNTTVNPQTVNSIYQKELERLGSGVYIIMLNTAQEQLSTQFVKY